MGYACPVCGDPQADGEHLANHLAFTAVLGDADHEDWLDEHAPEWADTDPAELAARVTDHADEREFPQVFEDTTDGGHEHDHDHEGRAHEGHGHGHDGGLGPAGGSGLDSGVAPGGVADLADLFDDADDESAPSDVLAEARELTEERRTNDAEDDTDGTDGPAPDEANGNSDGEEGG